MQINNSTVGQAKEQVERISESARSWIVPLAKFGYAAKGAVYIIIGLLAAFAAFGSGGKTTDSRGAFAEILSQPFGKLLLGIIAFGLAGYAIWRFVQAIKDTENKGSTAKGLAIRFGYAVIGLIHVGLTYSAVQMIFGSNANKSSERTSQEWTASLLSQPFGQWLVAAAGLGFVAFALYQFYKAYTAKFREKLMQNQMTANVENFAVRSGQIGLAARGVVFGIIGIFLIQAALNSNASEARGLGGAFNALAEQTYGQIALGIVALGFAAYGLYMIVLARYRRMIV